METIFITQDWEITEDPAVAAMVKVIDDNGRVTFGIRPGMAQNTFEGHEGRPGQVGGSLPRDAGGASSQDDYSRLASEKYARAKQQEPRVTKSLVDLAKKHGAEMQGLRNRLKTEESLSRKIKGDMKEKGINAEKAAAEITDSLRYTMTYDDSKKFTDSVLKVEKSLKSQGFSRYDTKYKNTFGPEKVYEGYNTVWVNNETGDLFELQFHTTDSLRIKGQNHILYEKFRISENETERAQYIQQMIDNWKDPSYERPLNYEMLGKE